jgi:SAM-dependent methyltransferase
VRPRAAPPQILIAGCGTGLHPIQVARAQPASAILAVDLSIASLAYAARMAERLGINNITFAQADLLRLGTLGRKFSVIESVGVLHHLEDPLSGWRVLTGLLEEDGLMRIALYSTRARSGIRAARDHLGPMNLPRTAEGIRRCRRAIMNLPDGHPARDVLGFGDFYTLNGCRDLLMHVQEHTFTPPQIAECLDTLGLRLLKVECGAQAQERFRTLFPDTAAATDPGAWDRLESAYPDTFRGMIQFWCGKA